MDFTHLWKLISVISASEDRRKYPQKAALREKNQRKSLLRGPEGLALAASSVANSTATRHRRLLHHRHPFSLFLPTILGRKAGLPPGLSAGNIHEYRRRPETKPNPPHPNKQQARTSAGQSRAGGWIQRPDWIPFHE